MNEFLLGMIFGIILVKLIEYKLKKSEFWQKFGSDNKIIRIIKIIREKKENDNKNN